MNFIEMKCSLVSQKAPLENVDRKLHAKFNSGSSHRKLSKIKGAIINIIPLKKPTAEKASTLE